MRQIRMLFAAYIVLKWGVYETQSMYQYGLSMANIYLDR